MLKDNVRNTPANVIRNNPERMAQYIEDVNEIRAWVRSLDYGGISQVAREIGSPQSLVSAMLRDPEDTISIGVLWLLQDLKAEYEAKKSKQTA